MLRNCVKIRGKKVEAEKKKKKKTTEGEIRVRRRGRRLKKPESKKHSRYLYSRDLSFISTRDRIIRCVYNIMKRRGKRAGYKNRKYKMKSTTKKRRNSLPRNG